MRIGMNGNCFEIGTIQAFLDGELASEISLRLTDHISDCHACARLMAEADEENSVVFSALERELSTLVPTQRLWTRINESIEVEKSHAPFWQKVLAYVRASLVNPSIAVAAGIILVFGMFVMLWTPSNQGPDVAGVTPPSTGDSGRPSVAVPVDPSTQVVDRSGTPEQDTPKICTANSSNFSARELRKQIINLDHKKQVEVPNPQYAGYLPGEESYVKTISDLKQNVDTQKDTVLTPSSRVSYERDMAVVNDSIKRMRDVVKKNPRNQAARQVLYASYQDKIDLLNSVGQREELIASLK